nr:MAG TPA: hypothetical protein [Caudoviricetes sp.]
MVQVEQRKWHLSIMKARARHTLKKPTKTTTCMFQVFQMAFCLHIFEKM